MECLFDGNKKKNDFKLFFFREVSFCRNANIFCAFVISTLPNYLNMKLRVKYTIFQNRHITDSRDLLLMV